MVDKDPILEHEKRLKRFGERLNEEIKKAEEDANAIIELHKKDPEFADAVAQEFWYDDYDDAKQAIDEKNKKKELNEKERKKRQKRFWERLNEEVEKASEHFSSLVELHKKDPEFADAVAQEFWYDDFAENDVDEKKNTNNRKESSKRDIVKGKKTRIVEMNQGDFYDEITKVTWIKKKVFTENDIKTWSKKVKDNADTLIELHQINPELANAVAQEFWYDDYDDAKKSIDEREEERERKRKEYEKKSTVWGRIKSLFTD